MKYCKTCKLYKDISSFPKKKDTKDGYSLKCKKCSNEADRIYRNKPEVKQRLLDKQQKYLSQEKVKKRSRYYHIFRRLKITEDDYERMLKIQKYVCAICKQKELCPRHKYLSIDHNHFTGKVRGLLCNKCNKAIGLFNDNIILLKNAIKYLKNYPIKNENNNI